MTPEQIAADVSARYGIPVAPDAVKIIPQGVSAHGVEYLWDGRELKATGENRSWKGQIKAEADRAKRRKHHNNVAKANDTRIRICVERIKKVRALADQGMTARQIADALGDTNDHAIRAFMRRHKIEFRRVV